MSTLEQAGAEGLAILRALIANGTFHHATYRDVGTIWEGLAIYRKDPVGPRGFAYVTKIPGRLREEFCGGTRDTNKTALDEAYHLIRAYDGGSGVHVGSFGNG